MIRRDGAILLAVLGAAAVLYGMFLPSIGLIDPDEGRHASIPVSMLRTGDFVVPHLQGFPYLEKPPLTYWMTAASYSLFGRSETSARLPVALMGFFGTLSLAWLAWRSIRPGAAWIAAATSVLTTHWFIQARYLTTDMILAGWMTVALCGFAVAALTGRRHAYWLFYIGAALATLAKGVIGFLLPAAIVVCFIVLTGRRRLLREMRPVAGTALGVAIVLPWFLMVQARLPDFLRYYIVDQHLARFSSVDAEHAMPFWFFLPVLLFGFFPWVVHLPFGRLHAARGIAEGGGEAGGEGGSEGAGLRRAEPLTLFLWLWFGVIVLFFSISRGKLPPYVLPAYPPLALLVAARLSRLLDARGRAAGATRRICLRSVLVGTLMVVAAPILWFALQRFLARDGRLAFSEVEFWARALIGTYAVGGSVILILALRRWPMATIAAQAGAQIVLFLLLIGGGRATDPYMSPRVIGGSLQRNVRPEDVVMLYKVANPSIEFYLGRPPILAEWTGEYTYGMSLRPNPDLVISDDHAVRDLLSSERSVYVLVDRKNRTVPDVFGAPVEVVAENRKRVLYRNIPREASR